jgi:phosphoglycerate kinase
MPIAGLSSINFEGKTVLLRCDLNVPLKGERIADAHRIDASLPTIRYVIGHGGAAVLCSHLGRPEGPTPSLSLKPVADYLTQALGSNVLLVPDCVGEAADRMVGALPHGQALLLENLRFHPEEEANDAGFARALARGKTVYVNDAFGTAHRTHASTAGVARFIAEKAAGLLMMRELEALRSITENPARPYILVMGGAKVSDKIGILRAMLPKIDVLLIGGAMAYTFMAARGEAIGRSRVESDKIEVARDIMADAQRQNVALVLPVDHIVADAPTENATGELVTRIPQNKMGLDIGSRTIAEFETRIKGARTILWNGPLGYFELPAFANGSLKVGEAIALAGAVSVLTGGDTEAAVAGASWANCFTHVSTGGGAALEYIEGRQLPGVVALER